MSEQVPENIRKQYRNPTGDDGRTVLENMNEHHKLVWEWCLDHMPSSIDGSILDIGCGGGGFIRKMSEKFPYAMLYGVDISQDAVDFATELNSDLISCGGLEIRKGSVESLPFDNDSIDAVTAMETYFFWPNLTDAVKEIHRVLSAGGIFVIGSEMQLRDDNREIMNKMSQLYGTNLVTDAEMANCLESAGFEIKIIAKPGSDIVAYIGFKKM